MSTPFVSRTRIILGLFVLAAIFIVPSIAKGQGTADTKTITIHTDGSPAVIEALKTAVTEAALIPVVGGGPIKIPIAVLKGIAVSGGWGWIGSLISQTEICRVFQQECKNQNGMFKLTLEIIIENSGPPKHIITIPMVASNLGSGRGASNRGYVAPAGPDGKPVMRMDVFGDGSLIISAIRCNMDKQ